MFMSAAFLRLKSLVLSTPANAVSLLKLFIWVWCVFSVPALRAAECPAKTKDFDPDLHSLYINQYGNLVKTEGEIVDDAEEGEYLDRIFTNLRNHKQPGVPLKLTFFVHGGLNTFESASRRPGLFSKDMLCEGYYPIFISWNSGFPTNYLDHLARIRKGESSLGLGIPTAPFVFVEDAARSVAHAPGAIYKEIEGPFKVAIWRTTKEERFAAQRKASLERNSQIHLINNLPTRGVGGSYWSVLNPVKLITAPFVDGLGKGSWNAMLRRTDLVLSKSAAFEGDLSQYRDPSTQKYPPLKPVADTAVAKFIQRWSADSGLNDGSALLIGHSMGTIIANNILNRYPEMRFQRVVYMGAAASIKGVEHAVVPWLHREAGGEFYNLSLDPYRELSERYWYDIAPRGSLLNWIDYIYGDVYSFHDRTAGSWWNMLRMAEEIFPSGVQNRVYLTRFPIGYEEQGPQVHGDFSEYPFWRESFWKAVFPLQKFSPEPEAE